MSGEQIIELTPRDLDEIIETASQRGAEKALKAVGLDDEHAVKDVQDLRDLMKVWRDARKTMLTQAIKVITTALLGALALGAAIQLGWLSGGGGNSP